MCRSDSTRGQNSSAPATTPTSGAKPSRKSGRNAPSCRQATPRNSPHNSSPGGAGCARPADQRNARGATEASARFQDELGSMRPSQLYPFSRRPFLIQRHARARRLESPWVRSVRGVAPRWAGAAGLVEMPRASARDPFAGLHCRRSAMTLRSSVTSASVRASGCVGACVPRAAHGSAGKTRCSSAVVTIE
jgi:hypothetical protein